MWNLKISIMMITTEFPLFFEFLHTCARKKVVVSHKLMNKVLKVTI